MTSTLEDVAFLARSENRVSVFTTLCSEPMSRQTVQERADVERVTLGRILGDFEERRWIEKTDGQYVRTPIGEMIAGVFEDLLQTVETTRKLDGVVQWLPTEEMPFDLQLLGTADITLPDKTDPAAPTRKAGERLRETRTVRVLMSVIVAEVVEACWAATVEGDQQFEAIFSPDVIHTISADASLSRKLDEMLESGQVTVYQSAEDFPYIVGLLDDIVAFGVTDEENLPRAYFELENETVRNWVEETYERYLETAEPLS